MENSDYSDIEDETSLFVRKIYEGKKQDIRSDSKQMLIDSSFSYHHIDEILDIYKEIQQLIHSNSNLSYFLDRLTPGDLYNALLQFSLIPVDIQVEEDSSDEETSE